MKAISVKLTDPLFHDLVHRARDSALSQSEIVRRALEAYLQADPGQPGATASCADRASRWAGLVQGPPDLASNPAYMNDFGE